MVEFLLGLPQDDHLMFEGFLQSLSWAWMIPRGVVVGQMVLGIDDSSRAGSGSGGKDCSIVKSISEPLRWEVGRGHRVLNYIVQ